MNLKLVVTVDQVLGENKMSKQKITDLEKVLELKILDFNKKGSSVLFYLGDIEDNNYGGDDWDDKPYEHNAGTVYGNFVKAEVVLHLAFDTKVFEPCDGVVNSNYSKDDLKEGQVPCLVVLKAEDIRNDVNEDYYGLGYDNVKELDESIKIYFNEKMSDVIDRVKTDLIALEWRR